MLRECGFDFNSKWSLLTSILNVPQEKIEKMRAIIEEGEAYEYALEIALEWWIKNMSEASWETLVPMVYRCGEINTADEMRKRLSKYALYLLFVYNKYSTFDSFVHTLIRTCIYMFSASCRSIPI